MLSHLVYVSVRKPVCTESEIQKILLACKRNNTNAEITGVLLYSESQFVQYLEGEYKEIIALYDKIKIDDRHKNAVLISSAPIKERAFPGWQMGLKKINETSIEFQTDMSKTEKELFHNILSGKTQEGLKTMGLIRKFFK